MMTSDLLNCFHSCKIVFLGCTLFSNPPLYYWRSPQQDWKFCQWCRRSIQGCELLILIHVCKDVFCIRLYNEIRGISLVGRPFKILKLLLSLNFNLLLIYVLAGKCKIHIVVGPNREAYSIMSESSLQCFLNLI